MSLLDKLQFTSESDADIDAEDEPVLAQDPEPGQRANRASKPSSNRAPKAPAVMSKAATTRMAKEVAEDLAGLLDLGATLWGLTDDCCAPVLEEQAKPIADALVGCLSRNPRLLAKFADTDIVSYTIQAAALFKALQPVGAAVYRNHVSKAVDDDRGVSTNGPGSINLADFPAYRPAFSA